MREVSSLVIQGKLNPITVDNYEYYLRFFDEVIYSYWYCDNDKKIKLISQKEPRVKTITGMLTKKFYNCQSIFCQCLTTLNGIRESSGNFVVKMRSDEYYEKMDVFLNKVINTPNKIITNNVFFRYTKDALYHPSDHLIGGTFENMIGTFSKLYRILEIYADKSIILPVDLNIKKKYISEVNRVVAEQLLAISFLKFKGFDKIPHDLDTARRIMLEYFDCVPVSELGEFVVRANSLGLLFTKPEQVRKYASIGGIEDL
jgi:hypothetical protein